MSQAIVKEANRSVLFLSIGFGVSFLIHGLFLQSFLHLKKLPSKREYGVSVLVPILPAPPPPRPETPPKPPKEKPLPPKKEPLPRQPVKMDDLKKINTAPVSHHRKDARPSEPVKPVFGADRQTLLPDGAPGIGLRAGNTLFKEQEKAVTKPEDVKQYVTTPIFDLTTLPVFKKQEQPRYPPQLEVSEIEGEVVLSVTIDEKGRVIAASVKKSDHPLFSKAAVEAMKKSLFSPGLVNGTPVVTQIDIPVTFLLED